MVVSYAYLWRYESSAGRSEARKTCPCVIIPSVEEKEGEKRVTVAPITYVLPSVLDCAIEIPAQVKYHLNLDDKRSWVILDEVNQFIWPGYDRQPVSRNRMRYDYGFLPPKLFEKIKSGILKLFIERRVNTTNRD